MSGAQGARFFARLCELIAEPSWMMEPEST
jgi:hypothetical protein